MVAVLMGGRMPSGPTREEALRCAPDVNGDSAAADDSGSAQSFGWLEGEMCSGVSSS